MQYSNDSVVHTRNANHMQIVTAYCLGIHPAANWVVTEYAEGVPFALTYQPNGTCRPTCESTSTLLAADQEHCEDLSVRIFSAVSTVVPTQVNMVKIHGNMIGGWYPHPDVANPMKKEKAIPSNGTWYSPDVAFYIHDIEVETKNEGSQWDTDGRFFLPIQTMHEVLSGMGQLHARAIYHNTLAGVLKFPSMSEYSDDSHIPSQMGLPVLEDENRIQGYIIRPSSDIYMGDQRLILFKVNPYLEDLPTFEKKTFTGI